MAVRGIRGATTVDSDSAEEIIEATGEMLKQLIEANHIQPEEIAGAWFTTTRDVNSEFPAIAARKLGWTEVPLLCGHEMEVDASNPRSIPRCIRVLVMLNTEKPASAMTFIYLRGAAAIKQDLDQLRNADAAAIGGSQS
ncbi:MAG TPA: chorismate mutase [Candidatus Dormibacteraeota bacterium]|nr:chorismate mutase [Candidatus Dormibacteraeota bacterium]